MPLIQLTESLIVHTDEIESAIRVGNYVDVTLKKSNEIKQIWDDKGVLWDRFVKVLSTECDKCKK